MLISKKKKNVTLLVPKPLPILPFNFKSKQLKPLPKLLFNLKSEQIKT